MMDFSIARPLELYEVSCVTMHNLYDMNAESWWADAETYDEKLCR